MSPLVGSANATGGLGNGKPDDDPGANPLQWNPNLNTSETVEWNSGWYGKTLYHGMDNECGVIGCPTGQPSQWDGTEYYFQVRSKIDPTRRLYDFGGGKFLYFTRTDASQSTQEIVTWNRRDATPDDGGNYFFMYRFGFDGTVPLEDDDSLTERQPGSDLNDFPTAYCKWEQGQTARCWSHSNGLPQSDPLYNTWDTYLYHIVPGFHASGDTIVQVWAAREGQTTYTKIWDQSVVNLQYSAVFGHNAIIATSYLGDGVDPIPPSYSNRYAQMIFSTQFIECPQV
jgi:hypothetical protein